VGIRGPVHARSFAARSDCDVVAICDADMSRAQRHADAVGNRVDIEKTQLTLGTWLEFDPDKEQFVGNAAADAMLTREYRKPFVVPSENEV
jgi:predicted dehydrogenase